MTVWRLVRVRQQRHALRQCCRRARRHDDAICREVIEGALAIAACEAEDSRAHGARPPCEERQAVAGGVPAAIEDQVAPVR